MAVSGLCAGWSVEPGAAAVGLITLLALWHFRRQQQLQPWMVVGFICLCLGGLMLVEAPGEMVRLELQRQYEYNPGLPADMYWTPLMFSINFMECFWPVTKLWLPLLLLIGIYLQQLPQGQRWNKNTKFQAVMLAGALSVMIVMLFALMARDGCYPLFCGMGCPQSVAKPDRLYQCPSGARTGGGASN